MAAQDGHEGCLRLLKEAGCDLGQANKNGQTPAHITAQNGHEGCLRLLKEAGCDLGAVSKDGEIPAHMAAREWLRGLLASAEGGWLL